MRLADAELAETWAAYIETRDAEMLEALVRHYEPLARYYARRAVYKAPAHQDVEDLMSSAHQGLLESVQRFEPDRGFKFETFAGRRIPGAIIDRQRRDDPLTRTARHQVTALRDAKQAWWEAHGRSATVEELARELDLTTTAVRALIVQQQTLTRELEDNLPTSEAHSTVHDSVHLEGLSESARAQLASRLARLTERDRTFILLYYVEGRTLREVGAQMNCSDSRCAQIRKEIMRSLLGS